MSKTIDVGENRYAVVTPSSGGEYGGRPVSADDYQVDEGRLEFLVDGSIVSTYAVGNWSSVRKLSEGER